MNASGSCYTVELSGFPDTSALSPAKRAVVAFHCWDIVLHFTFKDQCLLLCKLWGPWAKWQTVAARSLMTAAQWNRAYTNVHGNKRESICPVVRVSRSQKDLVFTVPPDSELEMWDWSTLTTTLLGHCSVRTFLTSAMTAALINTAAAVLLLWRALSQPQLQMGLGKAERQGKEEVAFESCHKLVISSPDN